MNSMTPPPKDAEERKSVGDKFLNAFHSRLSEKFLKDYDISKEGNVRGENFFDLTCSMAEYINFLVASETEWAVRETEERMLNVESAMFEEGGKAERKILAEEIRKLPSTFSERESDDYDEGMTYMKNRILQIIREDQSK